MNIFFPSRKWPIFCGVSARRRGLCWGTARRRSVGRKSVGTGVYASGVLAGGVLWSKECGALIREQVELLAVLLSDIFTGEPGAECEFFPGLLRHTSTSPYFILTHIFYSSSFPLFKESDGSGGSSLSFSHLVAAPVEGRFDASHAAAVPADTPAWGFFSPSCSCIWCWSLIFSCSSSLGYFDSFGTYCWLEVDLTFVPLFTTPVHSPFSLTLAVVISGCGSQSLLWIENWWLHRPNRKVVDIKPPRRCDVLTH